MADPQPASASAHEAAAFVPGPGQAVVTIWRVDGPLLLVQVEAEDVLTVGRRDGNEPRLSRDGDQRRLALPWLEPHMSRRQLRVGMTAGEWRVTVHEEAINPGRVRHWGDLQWRRVGAGDQIELRHGLVAVLMPGRPRLRITVNALPRPGSAASAANGGVQTEREAPSCRLRLQPAQLGVVVETFIDALCWPPPPVDGRVRGWSDHPQRDKLRADARRRNYDRLVDVAANERNFAWQPHEGTRGPDLTLLSELLDSGTLDYDTVARQAPRNALIPTHHTHRLDGQRREGHG